MNEYKFLPKTPELVVQRRVALDRYANLAQSSQLVLHLSLAIGAVALSSQIRKSEGSHARKGGATTLVRTAQSLQNALGTEVTRGFGTYGQWIFGLAWSAWLGYLCVVETVPGQRNSVPDLLYARTHDCRLLAPHQAIRPDRGLTATDPLPPLNMALHKVMGKIILAFFALHVSFYSYLFVQYGIFWATIQNTYIVVALLSVGIFSALGFTSMQYFRRRNYAWFYRVHVVGSAVVLPLLYFHVEAIRAYLIQSGVVLVLNTAYRMLGPRAKTY